MTGVALCLLAALTATAPGAEIRNVRISSPKILLSRAKSDSPVLVTGQFRLEMSFAGKTAHKPVVRLCCLSEVGGTLMMNCKFLDRPDTVEGLSLSEVAQGLKTAGVKLAPPLREIQAADPAVFTPCLRQVARETYASAVYGSADVRKGFFRLGRADKMPRLLLYRLEVWQNGVQVAKYESPHTGLGAYGIPADWHVWKRYPDRFRYFAAP
ncbi:MAG: hypothetical protein ACI4RD_00865 [Kiritimatiellia bacterium]